MKQKKPRAKARFPNKYSRKINALIPRAKQMALRLTAKTQIEIFDQMYTSYFHKALNTLCVRAGIRKIGPFLTVDEWKRANTEPL